MNPGNNAPQPGAAPPMAAPPPMGAAAPPVQAPPHGGEGTPRVEVKSAAPQPVEDMHIDELLHIVVDRNASDLHICANSEPVIREDGALKRLNFEKMTPRDSQRMMYDILSDENIHKFETTLELDFSYTLPRRARFRVNMYRDRGSVAAAFRLIAQKIPTVKDLNLPPILEKLVEKPRGLILV